jgi:hypothetical protein
MQVVDLERKQDHLNNYPAMIFGSSKSNDTLHLPRRTWLVIGLQIWQEFTGIGVVTVCESDPGDRWDLGPDRTDEVDAPTVFQSAGYSAYKADWLAGLNDITYSEVASTHGADPSVLRTGSSVHARQGRQTGHPLL